MRYLYYLLILFFAANIQSQAQNSYVLNLQDENHYIEIADNVDNDLDVGTDYCIEAWVYIKNTAHTNERIFRSQGWQIYVLSGTGSGGTNATVRIDGTFMPAGSIDLSVPTETWHHICLQGNAAGWTNNYLDGSAIANGGTSDITGSLNLRIGSYSLATTDFIGAIDEVRISNINRYSRWGFTVNRTDAPFVSDANTVLLFNFDNNTEFPPSNSSSKVFTITNYGVDAGDYFAWDDPSFGETLPLPVELTSFRASTSTNVAILNWQTATEVNNYGFEVQRAVDNSNNFETLDFIEGYGNSNSTKSYSYNDKSLVNGKYFYRLKQIDIDGEFEYSDVVAVEIGTPGKYELVQNYPNPFNPTTTIQFSIPEAANVNLTVFNALGEQVSVLANGMFDAGIHKVNFDASNLSSGIYFYQIKTQDFLQIKKMMLVK